MVGSQMTNVLVEASKDVMGLISYNSLMGSAKLITSTTYLLLFYFLISEIRQDSHINHML